MRKRKQTRRFHITDNYSHNYNSNNNGSSRTGTDHHVAIVSLLVFVGAFLVRKALFGSQILPGDPEAPKRQNIEKYQPRSVDQSISQSLPLSVSFCLSVCLARSLAGLLALFLLLSPGDLWKRERGVFFPDDRAIIVGEEDVRRHIALRQASK